MRNLVLDLPGEVQVLEDCVWNVVEMGGYQALDWDVLWLWSGLTLCAKPARISSLDVKTTVVRDDADLNSKGPWVTSK